MTTTSVTSLLLFNTDADQTLVAEVLGADPTATTFLLNCPSGTDSNDCGTYDESVTIGPWAQATPPPSASTGVYDVHISMGTEWLYSQHCEMSQTVPVTCTTTNIGGNDDGSPTFTFATVDPTDGILGWEYFPVTITSGLEKLASATASSESGATTVTGTTGTSGTTVLTGTQTSTGSAVSSTGTSAAIRGHGDAITGTFALAGLFLGWLLG